MMSLNDMTFCSKSECLTSTCYRHIQRAWDIKDKSDDVFIRDILPISRSDFSKDCRFYKIKLEKVDGKQ